MNKLPYSEARKRANEFADGLIKKLQELNADYEKQHPRVKPLVLGRCPNCDYDLSVYITRTRLYENAMKNLRTHFEMVPDEDIS